MLAKIGTPNQMLLAQDQVLFLYCRKFDFETSLEYLLGWGSTMSRDHLGSCATSCWLFRHYPCHLGTVAQIGKWWTAFLKDKVPTGSSRVMRAPCRSRVVPAASIKRVGIAWPRRLARCWCLVFFNHPSLAGWAVSQRSHGRKATKLEWTCLSEKMLFWKR